MIANMSSDMTIPEGIEVINGNGQYLIPGLTDAHVHMWQSANDLLLYLANGVTHVRELNGSEEHLTWKAEIQQGRPGPELFVSSRRHNSHGFFAGLFNRWTAKMNTVNDTDQIESQVKSIKDKGFDAIKIYTHLKKEHFQAFDSASKKHDIQILGHIPKSITLPEIWSSGMKELAHVEEIMKALDREFGHYGRDNTNEFLQFVQQRSPVVAEHLHDNNMAVISTMALTNSFARQKADLSTVLKHVELAYVNPGISESTFPSTRVMGWLPDVNIYRLPDDYPEDRKAGNQRYWKTYSQANQILLKAMAEKNVTILAGTDANVPVMVPGFSLHEELQSLIEAGMTESQVLRSATSAPADWMGLKTGRIEIGYQADLLLLDANPLADINNTQAINAVFNNGRFYNRASLDNMLKAVKKANDNSRNKPIESFAHHH
jgi:imidazolonepropionase-like amidohydrolase